MSQKEKAIADHFKDTASEKRSVIASNIVNAIVNELITHCSLPKKYLRSEDDFAIEYFIPWYNAI